MVDLRAFALIDQLQKQMVAYIGSTSRGYYPVTGQAALFLEIAPGMEINTITDAVMKKSNVRPGALVVERTYGMLEVHADDPADVKEAGQVIEELSIAINEADQAATQIVVSSRQQMTAMDQLVAAMDAIQQASHQSLLSTRQTEHSAQSLNEMARQLQETVAHQE